MLTQNDRSLLGGALEKDLNVYPSSVSETHADYTFSYRFNKSFSIDYNDMLYAVVNFTDFF